MSTYLFPFHASILKPNFDLTFREAEGVRDLDSPPACEVSVEAELLFKLQCLKARVGLAASLALCCSTSSSRCIAGITMEKCNDSILYTLFPFLLLLLLQ